MRAVTCELIRPEVWTLPKTAIELFGPSVSGFANKSTSYGIESTLTVDLTRRDDGQFLDLGTREDTERLEQMQQEHQTELVIGSAPCISFRTFYSILVERRPKLIKCKIKKGNTLDRASDRTRDN